MSHQIMAHGCQAYIWILDVQETILSSQKLWWIKGKNSSRYLSRFRTIFIRADHFSFK